MQATLGRSDRSFWNTTTSTFATQTITSGTNAALNLSGGKGTFSAAFGAPRGGPGELPAVLDEARMLVSDDTLRQAQPDFSLTRRSSAQELLMQAYSADRASYDKRLEQIFHEADGDGDGEIDKDDFVRFIASVVPTWSADHAKDVFCPSQPAPS